MDVLFLTAYDTEDGHLGGASWVDKKVISALGTSVAVHPLSSRYSEIPPIKLEISNDIVAKARTLARMLLLGEPFQVAKFRSDPLFKLRISEIERSLRPGQIVVTSQVPGLLIAEALGLRPHLHIAHNFDAKLSEIYDPRSLKLLRNSKRMLEFERKQLAKATNVVTLSSSDSRELSANGVFAEHLILFSAEVRAPQRLHSHRLALGFIGKLAWPPNRRDFNYLRESVLPALRDASSDEVVLVAAGRGTELETDSRRGIEGLGRIEDVEEFYEKVDVIVVPRMGATSGVSIKAIEAVEKGKLLIAPSQVLEECGLIGHAVAAEDADEIVSAILKYAEGRSGDAPPTQTFKAVSIGELASILRRGLT